MSLSSALSSYKSDLKTSYDNKNNDTSKAANDFTKATKSWATSGVPMTQHSGIAPVKGLAAGQTVAAFLTSTPGTVTADGVGGIDSSSAGPGLSSVKANLISSLTSTFSDNNNTSEQAADQVSKAINDYFSKAKIMTNVTATAAPGVSVPSPIGPVNTTSYTGTGTGGIDSSSPGSGFSSNITQFTNAIKTVYDNKNNTPAQAAKGIADAAESFFLSAKIDTSDSGQAGGGPATVDPSSGNGATNPPGSNIISGSSVSGTIS